MECSQRAATYLRLMDEAKALFDEWDSKPKTVTVGVGDSVFVKRTPGRKIRCGCGKRAERGGLCGECRKKRRSEKYPACECGEPYFAKGKCSRCYFREYNRNRTRHPKKRRSPVVLCPCGRGKPVLAKGMCLACYSKRRRDTSKQAKVA